jgi:hypothetical protein
VHVYVDGSGLGVVADGSRPDVGAAHPGAGDAHGFSAVAQVGLGEHTVCAFAIDSAARDVNTNLGCRTATR